MAALRGDGRLLPLEFPERLPRPGRRERLFGLQTLGRGDHVALSVSPPQACVNVFAPGREKSRDWD